MVRQGFGSGRVSVPSFGAEFRCRVSVPSFGAGFRCRVSVPSFDEDYITHARQITNIVLFAVDLLVAKYYCAP